MMIDYQIQLRDDMAVNEAVTENEDGSYTIFINSRLCADKQRQAAFHAMRHINNNDFEKDDVQMIESEAHDAKGTQT